MLGPVTAAKAAAGSRTTGPAGGSPRTNHCSRAGQDGRPAPPRSGSGCGRRSAAPRRCLRPGTRLRHKLHNTTPCIQRTLHTTAGHPVLVAPMLGRVALCCHCGQAAVVAAWSRAAAAAAGPGSAFSCSASPRPRPAPGLVTGAAADVNTPLPRPLPRPLTTASYHRPPQAGHSAGLLPPVWGSTCGPDQSRHSTCYNMLYTGHN